MSDAPSHTPLFRNASLIGGLAFIGGIAVALGAVQLGGGFHRSAAPAVAVTQPALQPQPAAPSVPPGTDIATLNAREAALAGKLDLLDQRIRDVDGSARTASTYATQAERLMIAFAVRRAVERGQPLGTLVNQLRGRFAEQQGDAVSIIMQFAEKPVTLEDLRFALENIAPRLNSAPDDSIWASARRMLGDMIVVRRTDLPSPRTSDRVVRARRALDAGNVEVALAEVAHTPGVANASDWTAAARRYIAARRALDDIEGAAAGTPAAARPIAG